MGTAMMMICIFYFDLSNAYTLHTHYNNTFERSLKCAIVVDVMMGCVVMMTMTMVMTTGVE